MENVTKLQNEYEKGEFDDRSRLKAQRSLQHLQEARIAEFRRDRAKLNLRGTYLFRMGIILALLLTGLSYFYIYSDPSTDAYLLLFVLFSGATGSVLSRAIKLGRQPLRVDTENEAGGEPPLGIRALVSGWKVFLAQPVIGATAALILFLIIEAGLTPVVVWPPAKYGLVCFLAGFSEPFFIGVLDKVAGQVSGSLH